MTRQAMVQLLRAMGEFEDSDDVLNSFLDVAEAEVLARLYPFVADTTGYTVPTRLERRVVEIALFLLNKRGAEGENLHVENGIERRYEGSGIPSDLMVDIVPFAGVVI